jgi:hypothetical protein
LARRVVNAQVTATRAADDQWELKKYGSSKVAGSRNRTVNFRGKPIGAFEASGDLEKDVESAMDVLRKKGFHKQISQVQRIFHQAYSFARIAADIYEKGLVTNPNNTPPFVVNSAFSIELYLKTVAQIHGKALRGHDLIELFDALPQSAVNAISSQIAKSKDIDDIKAFRKALDGNRKAFEHWRYLYEKSQQVKFDIQSAISVMKVLHDVCRYSDDIKGKTE